MTTHNARQQPGPQCTSIIIGIDIINIASWTADLLCVLAQLGHGLGQRADVTALAQPALRVELVRKLLDEHGVEVGATQRQIPRLADHLELPDGAVLAAHLTARGQ